MNKVILMGRLTREPDIRYTQGGEVMAVARYTLAVNRGYRRGEGEEADFIPCVVFRKAAEFAEKYLHQGMKILVSGRIQTGSYINNGQKVYTTEVIVMEQEFTEKKEDSRQVERASNGFINIPEGIEEDEFPF